MIETIVATFIGSTIGASLGILVGNAVICVVKRIALRVFNE